MDQKARGNRIEGNSLRTSCGQWSPRAMSTSHFTLFEMLRHHIHYKIFSHAQYPRWLWDESFIAKEDIVHVGKIFPFHLRVKEDIVHEGQILCPSCTIFSLTRRWKISFPVSMRLVLRGVVKAFLIAPRPSAATNQYTTSLFAAPPFGQMKDTAADNFFGDPFFYGDSQPVLTFVPKNISWKDGMWHTQGSRECGCVDGYVEWNRHQSCQRQTLVESRSIQTRR